MSPRILIADSRKDESFIQSLLAPEFEVIAVTTMKQATKLLKEEQFDLIMVDVRFDESRMFEVMQLSRILPLSAEKPVICFAVEVTPIGRIVHESLCFTARALGAWMFLSLHDLAEVEARRAELLRVIQRCLTGEERKKTHAARVDVHKRRLDIHQLRVDVEREEWSQELEDRLLEIRSDLTTLLHELCDLQIGSISQQESIDESRRMKDYVDDSVVEAEDQATRVERKETLEELNSAVDEFKITEREESKKKRRKHAS
jgi:response regulator RpfG family c-di-GMP phosphodiesterase